MTKLDPAEIAFVADTFRALFPNGIPPDKYEGVIDAISSLVAAHRASQPTVPAVDATPTKAGKVAVLDPACAACHHALSNHRHGGVVSSCKWRITELGKTVSCACTQFEPQR